MTCSPTCEPDAGRAQHRHVDLFVLVLVLHRQRPVVRRRPEEHEREKDHRRPRQRAGDGRPADQHREAAGDPAPHDVLLGAALEDHRVDDDVEEDGTGRQDGGEPVGREPEPDGGCRGQRPREDQCSPRRDLSGHERAVHGALHVRVDVAVEVHVERCRRTGAHRAAEHRGQDEPDVGETALREDHHRNGGHEQELEHARLRERDVRADRAAQGVRSCRGGGCCARRHRDVHRSPLDRSKLPSESMASAWRALRSRALTVRSRAV